ncbi:hypothetical protein Rsub_06716 [Raphidocelis subcapitata]|uniref:Uncharacterized protein n=1 Tax=Raphidocelis subcapitata TaxID=307507 RepID=A0A2V0P403_9CHLO|nr:hypothetical protein Rsub_06716 [Raphidocelis subcapitata]|eukprot:GBF94601.1 hypothetical protein Rsub_06716 [Raphidocelis subcapitata]
MRHPQTAPAPLQRPAAAAAQRDCARRRSRCRPRPAPATTAAAAAAAEPLVTERELQIKISVAASTGRLDLSDLRLAALPEALWELADLEELSLSGNELPELPEGLARLTSLRRLVLAGNRLRALPGDALGALPGLEGLWAHGNAIEELGGGAEALTALKSLSLAGNRLERLPDCLGTLTALEDLSLSGNRLSAVPPAAASLPALRRLALNGNALREVPGEWEGAAGLEELHLQGNALTAVPDGLTHLPALSELSLADNSISRLPPDLSGWRGLQKLHLYGNRLEQLPAAALLALPGLQQLWLEGNPLSTSAVDALLRGIADGAAPPTLRALGLDEGQLASSDAKLLEAARAARPGLLRAGIVAGGGPGYFKLQRGGSGGGSGSSSVDSSGNGHASSSSGSGSSGGEAPAPSSERVLVVAFGSAPGLPNWGGVLRQVQGSMEADGAVSAFDVLFVVDPFRDWYRGGDAAALESTYHSRLSEAAAGYGRVLMVGDSMGATAALLFSRLATAVLAFCPQVDLRSASIRPARPGAWLDALQANVHAALQQSPARVRVLTGTWQHDLAQASLLERHPNVTLKAYGVDSHRLALALARGGRLAPLLREAICNEAGLPSRNVRLANML